MRMTLPSCWTILLPTLGKRTVFLTLADDSSANQHPFTAAIYLPIPCPLQPEATAASPGPSPHPIHCLVTIQHPIHRP
ncbi:hypothetical protein C8R46DRAFT_1093313 [Mycena filopes]|nr:hypothetical protein C8R46DRAFT_1093313 [Mycena filopes]